MFLHSLPSLQPTPNTDSAKLILQANVHPEMEPKHLSTFSPGKTQPCFQEIESCSPSESCCLQMHYRVYQAGLNIYM